MKEVPCYYCDSTQHQPYAQENGFNLVKCYGCGLLFVNPRPDESEINAATALGVHPGERALDMRGSGLRYKYKYYLRVLPDIYTTELVQRVRNWLDIGCGYGEFLMALNTASRGNVKVKGLEPMHVKRESARRRGLDVTDFELDQHKEKYDCVSLLNVYSHLPNPPEFFVKVRRLLKPNGELLIQTGDMANLSPENQEKPLYLPSHLSFGNEEIVTGILKNCGLKIVSVNKYRADSRWILTVAIKEMAKMVLPGRHGNLRNALHIYRLSRIAPTDMWVRAALKD